MFVPVCWICTNLGSIIQAISKPQNSAVWTSLHGSDSVQMCNEACLCPQPSRFLLDVAAIRFLGILSETLCVLPAMYVFLNFLREGVLCGPVVRLSTSYRGGMGLTPGLGTKILQAWWGPKKKKNAAAHCWNWSNKAMYHINTERATSSFKVSRFWNSHIDWENLLSSTVIRQSLLVSYILAHKSHSGFHKGRACFLSPSFFFFLHHMVCGISAPDQDFKPGLHGRKPTTGPRLVPNEGILIQPQCCHSKSDVWQSLLACITYKAQTPSPVVCWVPSGLKLRLHLLVMCIL